MTARTPFWPLLKNELRCHHFGGVGPIFLFQGSCWLLFGTLPLVMLYRGGAANGDISVFFASGFAAILAFLIFSTQCVWVIGATIPGFFEKVMAGVESTGVVQHVGAIEFYFTRAMDRKMLLRARVAVASIFCLTPLLFNVALSAFAPAVNFTYLAPERFKVYTEVFSSGGQPYAPHVALMFALWLAWFSALGFLMFQLYGISVARYVKPADVWTGLYACPPLVVLVAAFGLHHHILKNGGGNVFENSFLLFARHPLMMLAALVLAALVVEMWSERKFSRLEIL